MTKVGPLRLPRSRRARVVTIGVAVAIILTTASTAIAVLPSDDSGPPDEALGGAILVADIRVEDGPAHQGLSESLAAGENVSLHETWLGGIRLLAGPDRTFYLVTTSTFVYPRGALVQVNDEGEIIDILRGAEAGAEALGSEGRVAVAGQIGDDERRALRVGWANEPYEDWYPIQVDFERPSRVPIYGLGVTDDDMILFGTFAQHSDDEQPPVIAAMSPDGVQSHLLGPPDDPTAQVHYDEGIEAISDLVGLPDGRIAFVGSTDDRIGLYIVDDDQVQRVETDDPVPIGQPHRIETGHLGYAIDHISPGPDGTVIAIGLNQDDDPVITRVDPNTGATTTLTTLEGVDTTIRDTDGYPYQVSAAAVGSDLYILANDKIWKLKDAFTG